MSKKRCYKKPNWFIYLIFVLCSKFYSRFVLNLKIKRNEMKKHKGSCVVIANHESVIDFMTLAANFPKSHFVISSSFYNTLPIQKLMDSVGVIPKQQFQTSPKDLKMMKEVVDNNMPLVIYPAGLMSEQGVATPIPESTGKFLKWLKQDVYVAKVEGTYLSKPKWSKSTRKGKTFLDVYKLYSKEDLENLNVDEIFDRVNEVLSFDAYKNQERLLVNFKHGDDINGLESVLYQCPKCHKEFQMKVENDNTLVCQECGNSALADTYGFLSKMKESDVIYKHPSDWALSIEKVLMKEIAASDDFRLKEECEIHLLNKEKYRYEYAGEGEITLDKEKIAFVGEINGEGTTKEFSSQMFITLPFVPNKHFDIQECNVSYRIKLKNAIATTKWIWSIKAIYQLNKK